MDTKHWTAKRMVLTVATAIMLVAILVSCASPSTEPTGTSPETGQPPTQAPSASSTPPGVGEAMQIVAQFEGPVTTSPPGPAFDASGLQGKKVWFVSFALPIDYSQQILRGVQAAGDALGIEVVPFDAAFSVSELTRGIDLAIQDQADAIVVHSIPAAVVEPALQRAHEAGILLVSAETQNPGPRLPDVPDVVDAMAGHSYSIPTEIMAAMVVADSGGDANVLFFSASDIGPGSQQGADTFVKRLGEMCPTCKVEVIDSVVAQWPGLEQRVASLLTENPDVNYVVPIFDGMAVFMVPGIRSAGAENDVKIVSGDATQSVLVEIRDGDIVIGDVGQPNVWTGVGIMDQTARLLVGVEPLDDIGIPYRIFTDNNVGDIDLSTEPTEWYGNVDFLAKYRQLWGLE